MTLSSARSPGHELCNHAMSISTADFRPQRVLEGARAGGKGVPGSGLGHDPLDEIAKHPGRGRPAPRLDGMAPGVNQGVAELKPRRDWTLKELLATTPSLLIALDSIMDPQNLGAILRSAEVAGCDGAILPEHRSAPLSPVAVKASSGASELLPIAKVSGMPSAIVEVKRAGVWCVALDPRGELLAWDFDFTQAVCVVVGSEGSGVQRLVKERCDARVRLPVAGHIASLNASAASAALLYEVMRQRGMAKAGSNWSPRMAQPASDQVTKTLARSSSGQRRSRAARSRGGARRRSRATLQVPGSLAGSEIRASGGSEAIESSIT